MDKLIEYLQYPFVVNAIVVGLLIALCASLIGVVLVLKRYSYLGDGLSHVAFGALSVATIFNMTNNTPFILIVTTLFAIILLRVGNDAKIKGDASIAMMSVGSLAVGYMLVNVFSTSTNLTGDVCTTLFGSTSILTLSKFDVNLSIIISIIIIILFIFGYKKIFAIIFDEAYCKATGEKVNMYNTFIAIVTAVIIVIAMRLVGSLLITALMIFPAISSMRIFKSFKSVMISSVIFGVIAAFIGLIISILWGTPVGATIVVIDILLFFIFILIDKFIK